MCWEAALLVHQTLCHMGAYLQPGSFLAFERGEMEGLNIQEIIRDSASTAVREFISAQRQQEMRHDRMVFLMVRLHGSASQVASDLRQMAELIERPCPT
jgi:hypothetical protein